ncbi:uncharacterized protein LOC141778400 [Sebastes fasciatus]|uniref:uncharacterized protein LOC141778400 n=1 Tax=Sebastes fasciatus TaxID=394691 RepID=UPI003D9E5AA4
MLVLLWATLLFAGRSNNVNANVILHWNNTNPNAQSGSRERLSMLDLSQQNCSIIINDLSKSDNGSYQVRLNGIVNGSREGFTSPTTTITVEDLIQKPTVMIPPLTEGQQTTLTCTAPGLCSGSEPNITWTWRGAGEKDSHITGNITAFKTENLTAVTQRHSSTLMFNPSFTQHHGSEVTCKVTFTNNITTEETVTLNVTYLKHVQISVKTDVEEDEALNLTCSIESFPPSLITWNKNLNSDTVPATLIIPNAAVGYSGQYICTAIHLDKTLTAMNVMKHEIVHPKILNSSGCIKQSEVLTCVCISEGYPLPTIKWPLLKNHAEYSVITTTVSHHIVNSTATLTVTNSNTSVECVSSNGNGKAKRNLTVNKVEPEEDGLHMKLLRIVTRLEIIITFCIGVLLSAIICCLVRKCHRKKERIYGNLAETLEMVTSHEDALSDADQAVEDYQSIDQVVAEAGGAVAAGKSDVPEYSKINFSLIKRRSPAEAGMTPESTETEYAEIKELKKIEEEADERQDGEDEEEMIGEDEEKKIEEKEGEDVALYSTVKDIMS